MKVETVKNVDAESVVILVGMLKDITVRIIKIITR